MSTLHDTTTDATIRLPDVVFPARDDTREGPRDLRAPLTAAGLAELATRMVARDCDERDIVTKLCVGAGYCRGLLQEAVSHVPVIEGYGHDEVRAIQLLGRASSNLRAP